MTTAPAALRTARAFRMASARWLGSLLLLCAAVMMPVFPTQTQMGPLPPGLHSPIVAFELAATRDEIETMFRAVGSPQREALRQAMDRGNRLDGLFLALYASFLAAVALALAQRSASKAALGAACLAPLAAAADVVENLQLFAITRGLGSTYDAALASLHIWTRIKWGALALALVLLAPALARRGRYERAVAAVCGLTGLLAVGAACDRTHFMEAFSLSVSIAFVALWVVALRARTAQRITVASPA